MLSQTSTQTPFEVAGEARQIFGGNGLSYEDPIAQAMRDVRASLIEDGTNEALALHAAKRLWSRRRRATRGRNTRSGGFLQSAFVLALRQRHKPPIARRMERMTHWQNRPEPNWQHFRFNQPYAKGLKRLKEDVLAKTDFDPATLWQWGTMQAMALIEILKSCEETFGADGQRLVYDALYRTGFDVGRQILEGVELPEGLTPAEFVSFFTTVINRIAYASLESPRIDSAEKVSFDIEWCPHQDHYGAFDCRVQRYFVQGMIGAAKEFGGKMGFDAKELGSKMGFFDVRFDTTIPAGAPTCHFTLWRATGEEKAEWAGSTERLERRALTYAAERRARREKEE